MSTTLPPRHRRAAYAGLQRDRLAALTEQYELDVPDRRVVQNHIDALVRARRVDFAAVLATLSRDEPKDICAALDLDDAGREKQRLIDRILALGNPAPATGAPVADAPATDTPEPPGDEAKLDAILQEVEATQPDPPKGRGKGRRTKKEDKLASVGFEEKLWRAADLLRSNMDAAEYKHVVLGLLFLKYISDAFEERRERLAGLVRDEGSDYFVANAAERAAELDLLQEDRDEYAQVNVFWVPREARWSHIRANAKQPTIGKLLDDAMDAIERENTQLKGVLPKIYAMPGLDKQNLGELIDMVSTIGLGSAEHRAKDTLGRVYEYFLARFASAEGKGGGEFFTPTSIVRVLVAMLEPYKGRVYDPCCGSGGMFVQSLKFIDAHDSRRDQMSIYGQESNHTTWRLARMKLAIRGIEANLVPKHADSLREDPGVPMVPGEGRGNGQFRDRRGETVFIDARELGRMETRVRVLDDGDIERIAGTYHAWRNPDGNYEDVASSCRSAKSEDMAASDLVPTPGRYVGTDGVVGDGHSLVRDGGAVQSEHTGPCGGLLRGSRPLIGRWTLVAFATLGGGA